jgi:hypothetical protein
MRGGSLHNTEDFERWYKLGLKQEAYFVEHIAPLIPIEADINPAKETDVTAPDLMIAGEVAELKNQQTPFFTVRRKFGLDPQFTITFNRGDYRSYKAKYPKMDIYFVVDWRLLSYDDHGTKIVVVPMKAIYKVNFSLLSRKIEAGEVRLHEYGRRKGDPHNETHGYVFSLHDFELLKDFTDRADLVMPM